MAILMNLINGATTTNLNNQVSNGCYLLDYSPQTYDKRSEIVEETIKILIHSSTATNLQSKIDEIERAFEEAEYRNSHLFRNRVGTRVYITFAPEGFSTTYRTELVGGSISYDSESISKVGFLKVPVELRIKRKNYWEDFTEREVTLKNTLVSAATGGILIQNRDDSFGDNHVENTSTISGTLPSPAKIYFKNITGSNSLTKVIIGSDVTSDHSSINYIYEPSNQTGTELTVTTGAGTGFSNGDYGTVSVTTSETGAGVWEIGSTQAAKMSGLPYVFYVRLGGDPPTVNLKIWLEIYYNSTTYYRSSPTYLVATKRFYELGRFSVPPGVVDATALTPVRFRIRAQATSGGPYTLNIDYVFQMPTEGGHRTYELTETGTMTTNTRILDDGTTDELHFLTSGNYSSARVIAYGEKIHLYPGKTQRLYCLFDDSDYDALPSREGNIQVYYRPRRRFI
jgi:hypothetical protein